MKPLIVEWPATAKAALTSTSQRGIVVVSYQGCTMKVLEQCDAGGGYKASSLPQGISEQIVIDTEDKLFAELPLGVASLKARVRQGQRLRLDYTVAGKREADGEPLSLQGRCEGATHYVEAMSVGAYALNVGSSRETGAGVRTSGGVGVGGETSGREERIHGAGDPVACRENPESPTCSAVLQLMVAPLPTRAVSGEKREGFGSGLGGLAPVPTVGKLRDLETTGLAEMDPVLLKKVEDAVKLERTQANSEQKRDMWERVEQHLGTNGYARQAADRRHTWELVAEGEGAHARKARDVCDKHEADTNKLKKLLDLDDAVVSPQKKASLKKEYDRAYAPFSEVFQDCEMWRRRAVEPWVATALERAEARVAKALEAKEAKVRADQEQLDATTREDQERHAGRVRLAKTLMMVGGGGAAVTGGVLIALGAVQASSATQACRGTLCPQGAKSDADAATLLGNVGLGLAIGGTATFLGGLFWPSQSSAPPAPTSIRVVPGPGDVGLAASAPF